MFEEETIKFNQDTVTSNQYNASVNEATNKFSLNKDYKITRGVLSGIADGN